jgi:polyisoprenyl-teichoic acid--peptidoglycan teichoic acid transferase
MTKQRNSIDGFIPRRNGSQLGGLHNEESVPRDGPTPKTPREIQTSGDGSKHGFTPTKGGISRNEIDESLKGIDDQLTDKKAKKRRSPEQKKRRRKIIKRVLLLILVIIIAIGGYVGVKTLLASKNVFKGNIFDLVQNAPLKADSNGRSNIIVFGTAEDDEGGTHDGRNLTDSLMLLSVDQKKKDAFMLSIPRDLWVRYAETCTVGNQGKINAAYFCASDDGQNEEAGAQALQAKIGEIAGVEVQYYIHLNFTAVVESVDAVGGVDVTIESEDPRGILDRNFDWKCNYKCHYVKYTNGQKVHLDGEHALALARARNASGGYGLPGGNFDREKNQQKVVVALKEKATSVGTLTNVGKVTGLIDALGKNLRTNFQTSEIRTLMDLGQTIKPENIRPLTLVAEENTLVTTGMVSGQSVVRPIAGILDYTDIQAYVKESLSSDPVTREKANVVVLNGSGVAGAGQKEADKLKQKGFVISNIATAPTGDYGKVKIYKIGDGNTATAARLKEQYGVTILTTPPPVAVDALTKFVVIIGTIASTN